MKKKPAPKRRSKKVAPWTPVGPRNIDAPTIDKRHRVDNADVWVKSGMWLGVKSSNVAAIRYDWLRLQLFVKFHGGSIYQYDGVRSRTAKDFFYASSAGRFVWQRLRDRYPYRRIVTGTRRGKRGRTRR